MLTALRSFVGSWAAKILLFLLVGSFALWGVSDTILGGGDQNTVATVGETKVSAYEFLGTYNQAMAIMQRQLGRRLTRQQAQVFGIEQRALDQMIISATLDEFARENGLALSEDTLSRLIRDNPAFQDSTGNFNRETFRRSVFEAQMNEQRFIEAQNVSAVRSQIAEAVAAGPVLPKAFSNALAQYTTEERKFDYITVTAEMAGTAPDPTDAQLREYFEANKQTYRAPEFRKMTVLSLEPATIADEEAVTEAEIKQDYESRADSYQRPERRRIQQIVFKDREKADEAVKSMQEGAVFETVLAENGVNITDADLGMVEKAALPAAVREEAFSLPLGEAGGILDGPFGPTMIRVAEVEPASVTSLEEATPAIRKDLALRRAADVIANLQDTIDDIRAGGSSLAEAADQLGFKAVSVEAVDREGKSPDGSTVEALASNNSLRRQAFQSQVGEQSSPVDVGTAGLAWYDVLAIEEPRDRTFDEAKDRVTADWRSAEQGKLVEAKAQEIKARVENGEALIAIAPEMNVLSESTQFLRRNASTATFPARAVEAGFAGRDKHVAVVTGIKPEERIVLSVIEVKQPDAPTASAQAPTEVIEAAEAGAADDLLAQLVAKLQSEYTLTRNPTVIDQVLTRSY